MPKDIIDFWFADETRGLWFNSTKAFDDMLRERYADTWEQARLGKLDHWMETADGCVALVIVLDQFPLNMFRGSAKSFATEAQSREVARRQLAAVREARTHRRAPTEPESPEELLCRG